MKETEIYWLNAYKNGRIVIDIDTGNGYENTKKGKRNFDKIGKDGYIRCSLYESPEHKSYNILLHRIIWIIANGEIPDKIEVNHKNGIKSDNRIENLELTNKSENALHSRRVLGNKGGCVRGEDCCLSKLKENQVVDIRNSYASGNFNFSQLAEIYDVTVGAIALIVSGKTWKHVGGEISERPGAGKAPFIRESKRKKKVSDEDVVEIKKLLKSKNITHKEIGKIFNVSKEYIGAINRNLMWKNIKLEDS